MNISAEEFVANPAAIRQAYAQFLEIGNTQRVELRRWGVYTDAAPLLDLIWHRFLTCLVISFAMKGVNAWDLYRDKLQMPADTDRNDAP